jgi:hypothetical protein
MAYQTIWMVLIRATTTTLSINLTRSPEVKSKIKKSKDSKLHYLRREISFATNDPILILPIRQQALRAQPLVL